MTRVTYHTLYTTDLEQTDFREAFEARLRALRADAPESCAHLVGGELVAAGPQRERRDPSCVERVVATYPDAPAWTVERAVEAARAAAPSWAALAAEERAALLRHVIDRTEERKVELTALLALETGKPRVEALGEVEEIVELVRIYCDAASDPSTFEEPLSSEGAAAGVRTRSVLRPYGVFGVIAPFNYPMALAINMAVPALLAGNAVVIKPSDLAPRSASAMAELLGDLPAGVVNVVHGGDVAGRALVDSDVDGIAFTGSAAVGLGILRQLQAGPYPKPVIAEMGGKNPTIVAASADLGTAAAAIRKSAFGLSGQKCSSCSRVLVADDAYEELVELLRAELAEVRVGDPIDPRSTAGPLIDEHAMARFRGAVAEARAAGALVVGGEPDLAGGHFAPATIAAGLPLGHRLTREELFMPFLTVTRVPDVRAAIDEANAVPVGLTAGIFSGDDDEIRDFLERVEAGCTFVNHPTGATTGVWPGTQTFGGWKASGTTGKHSYGRLYVQQFARQQCQTVYAP